MDIKSEVTVAPGLNSILVRSEEPGWKATVTVEMQGNCLGSYKTEKQARTAANQAVDRVVGLLTPKE